MKVSLLQSVDQTMEGAELLQPQVFNPKSECSLLICYRGHVVELKAMSF